MNEEFEGHCVYFVLDRIYMKASDVILVLRYGLHLLYSWWIFPSQSMMTGDDLPS
jgi:hypothetical protein